ncbi:hypothetical protein LCGC14_0036370 [marine sediment metagenome]|uniref:Uncharacterized protein n=1 Tax=marine sediment metagenome TaxID=412755 RepID=A0A0F9VW92_9ZZZZ
MLLTTFDLLTNCVYLALNKSARQLCNKNMLRIITFICALPTSNRQPSQQSSAWVN